MYRSIIDNSSKQWMCLKHWDKHLQKTSVSKKGKNTARLSSPENKRSSMPSLRLNKYLVTEPGSVGVAPIILMAVHQLSH